MTIVASNTGSLGFVFRRQDEDNYYGVALYRSSSSEAGTAELYKVVNGAYISLCQRLFSFNGFTPTAVTVTADGNRLSAFVQGIGVCDTGGQDVVDTSFISGKAGLFGTGTTAAGFFDLAVQNLGVEPNTALFAFPPPPASYALSYRIISGLKAQQGTSLPLWRCVFPPSLLYHTYTSPRTHPPRTPHSFLRRFIL